MGGLPGAGMGYGDHMDRPLVIGTRGSPLALWQARWVRDKLARALGLLEDADLRIPIEVISTSGDRLSGALSEWGGKGLFTRELEVALVSGAVDLAVHSMKDVPTVGRPELAIAAVLERADVRDAFLSPRADSLMALPDGALVGSASIRRRAQAARVRPDLRFVLLRGNVGTRLDRLREGVCDATFLACAGLDRLGQGVLATERVDTDLMLPAPAQGAVGVEVRADDAEVRDAVARLDHAPTRRAVTVERAFLQALDGSCRTPIAALLENVGEGGRFRGEVIAPDGTLWFSRDEAVEAGEDARAAGLRIGESLRNDIGGRIVFDA